MRAAVWYGKTLNGACSKTDHLIRRKEVGTKAPGFTLPDAEGNLVSLADFAGKRVVLYFYPRDNTPGCTRQACAYAGAYEEFKRMNAAVIGISKDSAIQGYGVWQEKKNYGKVSMGVVRSTFVISEDGVIERVMPKVKPDTNAAEVLAYLKGEK